MTFTQILANANVLGDYLLGRTSEKRTVSLTADNVKIVLTVTPRKYNVETAQMNILDFGEALIFGNAKLKKIKFGIARRFFKSCHIIPHCLKRGEDLSGFFY